MAVSSKCSNPFRAYFGLSSTTIIEPLSAFFMTMLSRLASRFRAMRSSLVRFFGIFFVSFLFPLSRGVFFRCIFRGRCCLSWVGPNWIVS